jgi:septum formation protein
MSKLILASGSRYKRELMARLGLPFDSLVSGVDEQELPGEPPHQSAARLAREKALALVPHSPDAWIIGCDQVVSVDGHALHKPVTAEAARAQLKQLAGRCHDLCCAIALVSPSGQVFEAHVLYELEMRPLSDDAIAAYIAEDEPLDCAGSYRLEAGGIRLFRAMRGDDYTAIVGLPLTRVWALLEQAGYPLPH